MSDALESFFAAWGKADTPSREAVFDTALAHPFRFADPGTPHPIEDIGQLADYVAADAGRVPATTAIIIACDRIADCARVLVEFRDDNRPFRRSQYFAALDDTGRIVQITGFNGTGEQE